MMYSRVITRFVHMKPSCWASEKSQLATLRKRTGYTFTNCKKALELHNNDLLQAENWLNKQAQALGWSKATKLEGRQTTQGLVGAIVDKNNAALVEINCETDFVARNEKFQEMVRSAARACLQFAKNQPPSTTSLVKICLEGEQFRNLIVEEERKTLADQLALVIGSVGENATLRRAMCFKAVDDVEISAYAHPSNTQFNEVLLGRFAGLIALKRKELKEDVDIQEIGRSLCQHVVGMDPKRIGTPSDEPAKNIDDETTLIYQEFLNDNSYTVNDILEETGLEVVDFKRFECGENLAIGVHSLSESEIHKCQ